jgi:hypothetical protein
LAPSARPVPGLGRAACPARAPQALGTCATSGLPFLPSSPPRGAPSSFVSAAVAAAAAAPAAARSGAVHTVQQFAESLTQNGLLAPAASAGTAAAATPRWHGCRRPAPTAAAAVVRGQAPPSGVDR